MSGTDIGPALAEPLNETQAKARAFALSEQARVDAINADHAAHDANEANKNAGKFADSTTAAQKRQEAASNERNAPANVASDENADEAEERAKDTRAEAVSVIGEEEAATALPPEPEFDPKVAGRGRR